MAVAVAVMRREQGRKSGCTTYVYTRSVGIWGGDGDQDFYESKHDNHSIKY